MPYLIYTQSKLTLFRLFTILLLLSSCQEEVFIPKPKTYHRIDIAKADYRLLDSANHPYSFEYNQMAKLQAPKQRERGWLNLYYPNLNATIYLSYKPANAKIANYIEESRALVYNHTIRASYIEEIPYLNPVHHVQGVQYILSGKTASALQFYATDSLKHFIRGSLYFNQVPNPDSLAPVIDYIKKDVQHFLESLQWK